jgi:3-phenylpropionate/trans-cinnamate dioxygenase ferredoxin subunit
MADKLIDAGEASALRPGRMQRFDFGGRRILIANVAGRFCAVDDTCTHEDASLSSGVLEGEWVRCPLHGSRFNVCTGQALEEPADVDLRSYPVRIEGERILVALPDEGTP